MTGFGGRQTTRGQEWEQETGEEVAASCPGERPCSGSETGELCQHSQRPLPGGCGQT